MTGFILVGTTEVQHESVRIFGYEHRQFAKFNRPDAGNAFLRART
jgi:hypothetical protein